MSGKITVIKPYFNYVELLPGNKGLSIDEKIPFEAYTQAVQAYGSIVADGLWALGDLFVFGERVFGEDYAQAFENLKYSEKTVKDATWICATFPPSRRHKLLTFNHHKIVAGLEPEDREALLNEAEKSEMSTRELTRIKKEKFPSKRTTKKKKTKDADGDDTPDLPEAKIVTQPEMLKAMDIAIAYWEAQDPRVHMLAGFRSEVTTRFNALRRNLRRFDFAGGNK